MSKILKIYAAWIYVRDLNMSKKFYQKVLGLKIKSQDQKWIEFDTGETVFALLHRSREQGDVKPQKTHLMLQVDDLKSMERTLQSNKVNIIGKKVEPYGTLLTFEDPDGHWLELYEPKNHSPKS